MIPKNLNQLFFCPDKFHQFLCSNDLPKRISFFGRTNNSEIMKNKLTLPVLAIAFILFSVLLPPGCSYDSGVVEPPEIPKDSTLVSFSEDIIPIFNEACNLSGCHSPGATPPDLSPANAYYALWDGMYIDTLLPQQSELLQWMLGNRRIPMPLSGPNQEYNTKVFNWIDQGANNN